MTCALCESDSGLYEMNRTCCKVRFLMNEPRLDVRRAWLDRWSKRYGSKEVAAVKEEFARQWEQKQKQKGGE